MNIASDSPEDLPMASGMMNCRVVKGHGKVRTADVSGREPCVRNAQAWLVTACLQSKRHSIDR